MILMWQGVMWHCCVKGLIEGLPAFLFDSAPVFHL